MPSALTLPIISISPYVDPSSTPSARAHVASALHTACRDIGFFYIRIDDLPFVHRHQMDAVVDVGRRFFQLPIEEKEKIALKQPDAARGYQRLKQNVTQGRADHHEGLDFYAESPYPPGSASGLPLSGTNQWPTSPPDFKPTISDWMDKMKLLGMAVMRAMADGLGMDQDEWEAFKPLFEDSFWVMRVIGYPPLPDGEEGISCGAHKDYGCLTLLHADSTPHALQVFLRPTPDPSRPQEKDTEGVWIDANPVDGCLVVNVGEMWEIWSNGLYRSTLHRVIHRSATYRVSLPFFYEPAFDAVVAPLDAARRKQEEEGCTVGKRYDEVVYGEFLVRKVGGNFVQPED